MCGIAGAVFCHSSEESVQGAMASLSRRGPDGSGVWRNDGVTLVHARLAVIELSDLGAQPMRSECGNFHIVFNGEIYNHAELREQLSSEYTFKSHSDTEVILASYIKYGASMLSRFVGMFSMAIWDSRKSELFVARDRLGVKPLYYAVSPEGAFAFGSRPSALFALVPWLKRKVNRQGLRYFYEAGYVPAPHTIFEGVAKLEPGTCLVVRAEGIEKNRYWSAEGVQTDQSLENAREEDLLDELDMLISESVRSRMVSDVPIGAFLSGGIDSSLVAAYMAKHSSQPIHTFTIGFQEASFDESSYASDVAKHLGTVHVCENLAVDALLDLMPTFIREYDEPFFDYSAFPVMAVSRLARRSVTVSLSGDGGDEVFGGYHYYNIMRHLERAHQFPGGVRNCMQMLMGLVPHQKIQWLGTIVGADGPAPAFSFMRGTIKDAAGLMQPSLLADTQSMSSLFFERVSRQMTGLSYAEIGMRLDLALTLPDDYLQKVDVGSMAFSLEARDPLLDHRIIEWGAKLPLRWKIRNGKNKYLLRQLAYRHVPQSLLDRPKMGFGVPIGDWLRGGLKEWGESLLADSEAFEALELNSGFVKKMWSDHQAGILRSHSTLWSALVALQFYRSHLKSV